MNPASSSLPPQDNSSSVAVPTASSRLVAITKITKGNEKHIHIVKQCQTRDKNDDDDDDEGGERLWKNATATATATKSSRSWRRSRSKTRVNEEYKNKQQQQQGGGGGIGGRRIPSNSSVTIGRDNNTTQQEMIRNNNHLQQIGENNIQHPPPSPPTMIIRNGIIDWTHSMLYDYQFCCNSSSFNNNNNLDNYYYNYDNSCISVNHQQYAKKKKKKKNMIQMVIEYTTKSSSSKQHYHVGKVKKNKMYFCGGTTTASAIIDNNKIPYIIENYATLPEYELISSSASSSTAATTKLQRQQKSSIGTKKLSTRMMIGGGKSKTTTTKKNRTNNNNNNKTPTMSTKYTTCNGEDNGGQVNENENVVNEDIYHDRIVLPPPSSSSAAALPSSFISLGAMVYNDNSIIHNTISPLDNTNIMCINSILGIYVIQTNISNIDCASIINTADAYACSRVGGSWSSYTYAKQTLGCRENDRLAYICAKPVLTACATIRHHLRKEIDDDTDNDDKDDKDNNGGGDAISSTLDSVCQSNCNDGLTATTTSTADPIIDVKDETGGDSSSQMQQHQHQQVDTNRARKEKELVLDIREPHVVKYDTINTERRKLDMHTDKSEWTFIIALSQGGSNDYSGGGTYFQALDSTIHLRRSQMLVFRGKLRHCGVTIQSGCRYLLVGFLVPQNLREWNSSPFVSR